MWRDQVIDTHIPWEQGLVDVPQVPEMKVFPGSSNVSCAIHWCLTAEVMQALGTGGLPDGTKAHAYLTVLLKRLEEVNRRHRQAIAEEAVGLARRVIGGGHVDVNGSNEGVRGDANTVAQGLMLTCAHERRPAAAGGDTDTLIITAVSARPSAGGRMGGAGEGERHPGGDHRHGNLAADAGSERPLPGQRL